MVMPQLFSYYILLSSILLWYLVESFLNVTSIAANISQRFVNEVEENITYTDVKELNEKLGRISETYCEFAVQSKCFEANAILDAELASQGPIDQLISAFLEYRMEVASSNIVLMDICGPSNTLVDLYEVSPVYGNDSVYLGLTLQIVWLDMKSVLGQEDRFLLPDTDALLEQSLEAVKNSVPERCGYQSYQQFVINLLKRITSIQSQGFIVDQYVKSICKVLMNGYDLLEEKEQNMIREEMSGYMEIDLLAKLKDQQKKWIEKLSNVTQLFKQYLSSVSQAILVCADRKQIELDNFQSNEYLKSCDYDVEKIKNRVESFQPGSVRDANLGTLRVFQKYVVNEKDINKNGHCMFQCSSYSRAQVFDCYDEQICARQDRCNGTLWHCRDGISPNLKICPSARESRTRYDCIQSIIDEIPKKKEEIKEPLRYGSNCGYCPGIENRRWTRWFWECSYCMCTCEESNRDKVGLFNLRDVVSEIELNYVVTGVRFIEKNHVVHIQIQQGKLKEYGTVSMTTCEWKPVEDYRYNDKEVKSGRDYHPISWYKRTFCMDKLNSPANHVITGFRFKLVNKFLKFEIRISEFDFVKGKIFPDKYRWISNGDGLTNRTMINLEDVELSGWNDTQTNQCFQFNTSTLEIDVGQSTIPYINFGSVEPTPAVPLAGARIFLEGYEQFSSFLKFKLYTYNIDPHFPDGQ